MSQDETISLTYSSPLRVNVRVSGYFVQVQVQLALERVHRVRKCNVFWQIVPWGFQVLFFFQTIFNLELNHF